MTQLFRRASMLALAAAATACGTVRNDSPVPLIPTEQFAIEVRQTPEELAIIPSAQGLSSQQVQAVAALAQRWRDGGGGDVSLRQPYGAGDPRATEVATRATAEALVGFGVPAEMIRVEGYDARAGGRGDAPVLVAFERHEAVGPQCAETWTDVDATFHARSSGNFGCSTTANIAAQIANPRDLIQARAETPADAVRRQTQLGLYRAGQPTGATRSQDERTAISNVARQ